MMTQLKHDMIFSEFTSLCQTRLDSLYLPYLDPIPILDLKMALKNALQNKGKQFRPLLIYATGSIFNATLENLDLPALAVELIHTYSLIHDDLPAMDNADLRRGQASCHKTYGEGIAILTGDGLLTLAMQILAAHPAASLKPNNRLKMIETLSQACGILGMIAGQAQDITIMHDQNLPSDILLDTYHRKTGALFTACLRLGQIAAQDEDEIIQSHLERIGNNLGLAFQIQDDIQDITQLSSQSGKTNGIDKKNGKQTYPSLFGIKTAHEKIDQLFNDAIEAMNYFGDRAQLLRTLIHRMLNRSK